MLDDNPNRRPGWKPRRATVALLVVGAFVLAGVTCWIARINPWPTPGHVQDPGWFLTFVIVYFFGLYLVIERLLRK